MFNPKIVYDLLEEKGLKHKDLLNHLGKNQNGSLKQLFSGDIKASNIEKIADFLEVSIDLLFERSSSNNQVVVAGVGNKVHNFNNQASDEYRKSLEALMVEKDKRIKNLEDMIEILKLQLNINTKN